MNLGIIAVGKGKAGRFSTLSWFKLVNVARSWCRSYFVVKEGLEDRIWFQEIDHKNLELIFFVRIAR